MSMFRKVGLNDLKSTRMTLQLADYSIRHPRGIIEDVLIKVDKFVFPVGFVILDVDEDVEVPLIFGRPFLATSKALIDVSNGRMTLKVGDEEVMFSLSNAMKHPSTFDNTCYFLDRIDSLMNVCKKFGTKSLSGSHWITLTLKRPLCLYRY
ncbi:uncharacterized protein LOC120255110 [Dioscorea cayenensis subsp. rotundata]|uniref:Uncharacterized protein LOC120255110 n=1 Tax=Dioscorea cayennensis subsp. rotundata TaxID=55577 RepID=A0AB40AWH9_DIOCR|nr:uncharacterized protein LOC120255110 [Dioscorea cayenensis subsp. rotundata]